MSNLKQLRKEKNLFQLGVEMKTGIDQSLLSKYERKARIPTTEHLIILAKFYNTSLDYIMELTDVREPYPRKK